MQASSVSTTFIPRPRGSLSDAESGLSAATDANGATFFFTIKLTETAGVATTLTGLGLNGANYAGAIADFFGSATLPAQAALSASMKAANIAVPASVTMVFSGSDASGATWTRQIAVPFLRQP